MNVGSHPNLIQPVLARAQERPDQTALVFVREDGVEERLSAGEFGGELERHARHLLSAGIGPGELVILVMRHSRELLSAFWGAMRLGAIPSIFPFLNERLDLSYYLAQLRNLVTYSGASVIVTSPDLIDQLAGFLTEGECRVILTDGSPGHSPEADLPPVGDGEGIAFLQHSSGTTGLQKGVALSHRAVLNQLEACSAAIALNERDVVVSWLPLYHDMGLIAGFVLPIVTGTPLVLMSPFHWVRDPKILLKALHAHRGTLCWLPNFAYNHLARAVPLRELDGLDLSAWRMAINCSEPVRADSHRQFLARFAPYGFRGEALGASYAMAENTFAVTQTMPGEAPRLDWIDLEQVQRGRLAVPKVAGAPLATAYVSCGTPISGAEVRIVGEGGEILEERQVGEIVIRSNSLLSGYHRRPDLTAAAVRDGWFYTGDMGYLADGELYISGRKKDLIIVGGKNIYPQDLEAIAGEVPGIYPGRAVAFGVMDERLGTESVVMVCELEHPASEEAHRAIESELRRRIVQNSDVTLADVHLVDKRWLIKTSSGKLARAANRERYLQELQD
jgi:fatty-acyl-CoA synthase